MWTTSYTAMVTVILLVLLTGTKAVKTTANLLCNHYASNRNFSDNDWPPYHPKHYTPLTIVHHAESCTENELTAFAQRLTRCGSIEADMQPVTIDSNAFKTIKELFAPFEGIASKPYIMLIEGAPGIGKTILCKEIASQWSSKDILRYKALLFLLYLRDPRIKGITGVKSMVQYFCQSDELTNDITDWLVERDGENLIIVIDGYDEITDNTRHNFINDVIRRNQLSKCCLVITSRPAASLNLHRSVNCRAEVLGFTEQNRLNFIEMALQGQNDKIEDLKCFLHSNTTINALCYIPLNMSILLCLARDGINELPNTQTILYHNFVIMTVKRFLPADAAEPITLDSLEEPYNQVIKELAKFAFLSLEKDKLVFSLAEIPTACHNRTSARWYGLGLLKCEQHFKPTTGSHSKTFHFLHFSVQEYMAAHYIASLPDAELLLKLNQTFWKPRYFNMWIMYVGITGGTHVKFMHFLSGNSIQLSTRLFGVSNVSNKILNDKIKSLHLMRCLAEGKHKMFSSVESIFQGQIIDLSHQNLSPDDVRTLAIVLLKSPTKHWEEINLSHCNIDEKCCDILCEIFNSQKDITLKIKKFNVSYNCFPWESLTKLCEKFKAWSCEKVIVSIDSLYDRPTMNMITWFTNKVNKKIQNSLEGIAPPYLPTRIHSKQLMCTYLLRLKRMVAVYSDSDVIQMFQYADCDLSNDMIEVLRKLALKKKVSKIIFTYSIVNHHNINFHNVVLCGSNMHAKNAYRLHHSNILMIRPQYLSWHKRVADYLTAVVCYNARTNGSYLKTLAAKYVDDITNYLQNEHALTLKEFNIENNYVGSEAAKDIAVILLRAINLNKLILCGNNFQAAGSIILARAMEHISNLRCFGISNNNISYEAADAIANVLSHNINLKELYLGGNNLQAVGANIIMQGLKNTSSLTVINIASNCIKDKATNNIASVLAHNTKLKEVYLGGNNLPAASIFKIARILQSALNLNVFSIEGNDINNKVADDIESFLFHEAYPLEMYVCGSHHCPSRTSEEHTTPTLIALKSSLRVTILDIDGGTTDEYSNIQTLPRVSTVTVFDIKNDVISDETLRGTAEALFCAKLQVLNLHRSNFAAINTLVILDALKNSKNLIAFNIENNDNICDKAVHCIAAVLLDNDKLQNLNISGNNLKAPEAIIISQALVNASNLILFNISNNDVGSEAAAAIAAVLSHNPKLQELYLGGNNLGAPGMIIITDGLKDISTLIVIDMSSNNISDEAADGISDVIRCNSKLRRLYLQDNILQTTGTIKIAEVLDTVSSLAVLNISNNSIGAEAANSISRSLCKTSKLQKFYLGGNNLQALGLIKIAIALRHHSKLKELNISNNGIGDDAADDVAAVLSRNTRLRVLEMHGNQFRAEGGIKVMNALKNTSNVVHLDVESNNIDDNKFANNIISILSHNSKLQKLYIGDCNLEPSSAVKLQKALQNTSDLLVFSISNNNLNYKVADNIATILSHNTKLQKLYLGGNNLQASGAIKIARGLQNTSNLRTLNMSNNNICDKAANDIVAVLCHNVNLEVLELYDNNLETIGAIKLAKALHNISFLSVFEIILEVMLQFILPVFYCTIVSCKYYTCKKII